MRDASKLKRLVTVQRHLERMAEVDLARTAKDRQEIEEQMEQSIEALGSMEPVHLAMKGQYGIQFSRLGTRSSQMEAKQEVQEKKFLKEKAKADRLENNYKRAKEFEDRESADTELLDLLDQTLEEQSPASSKLDHS
jgi:hypothetical protein